MKTMVLKEERLLDTVPQFIVITAVFMLGYTLNPGFAAAQSVLVEDHALSVEFNVPGEVSPTRGDTYLLGTGDVIRVDVFNIPDYGGEFRVLSGGVVNLPVAGAVVVGGLSLQQAAAEVEQKLGPFVRRPRVTLSLLEARPLQIAIAGEVNRPGAYRIIIDDNSDRAVSGVPTLTQAIELAGGITQLADIRQIEVQRPLSSSTDDMPLNTSLFGSINSQGGRDEDDLQSISINLWELLKTGNLDEDLPLKDGDRILIPTATVLSADEIAELASASFSPDEITVNVVGEVDTPGAIQVPPNTPLNQAILAAGGFNNRARSSTVNLVRLNPNGTVSEREIKVDFSQGINDEVNPALRPNDTVIVRRSGLTRVTDTVGTVLSPVSGILNILRLLGNL